MRHSLTGASAHRHPVAKATRLASSNGRELPEDRHPPPPLGLALIDSNYHYLSVNSTLAAMHGRSIDDHLGRSVVDAVQPSVHHLLLPAYRQVITTGIAVENIIVEAFAGTRLKRCIVSYHPVKLAADPLWGVHVIAVEITPSARELPEMSRNCNCSPMQLKVLKLIGECKSTKEIADLLHISPSTVSTHRKAIFQKTNLHTTTELVCYAATLFPRHPLPRG